MTLDDLVIIRAAAFLVMLTPCLIGIINWRSLAPALKFFTLLLVYVEIYDALTFILFKVGINPNITASICMLIDSLLVCYFYYLISDKRVIRILPIAAILISLFSVANLFFIQKENPNYYSVVVYLVSTLALALRYIYSHLASPPKKGLISFPLFWINSGFIIQASGTLSLFIISDYLVNVINNDMIAFSSLIYINQILVGLFFIYALWLEVKTSSIQA